MNWLLIPIGALLWRIRGGLLNSITGQRNWLGIFNDTAVRIIWALGMAGLFWIGHPMVPWRAGLLALSLFGETVIGWWGLPLEPARAEDVAMLSLNGMIRMSVPAVVLLSPWVLLAGALCGPAYWIGARLPAKPDSWQFWGEWIFGAIIGAGLALS